MSTSSSMDGVFFGMPGLLGLPGGIEVSRDVAIEVSRAVALANVLTESLGGGSRAGDSMISRVF